MTTYKDSDSGAIFPRDKKKPSYPDMGGEVTLSKEMIDYLNDCVKQGIDPKIQVGAWRKQGRSLTFLSLKLNKPFERSESPRQQNTRQQDAETARLPWED